MIDWQDVILYLDDGRSMRAKARMDETGKITVRTPPETDDMIFTVTRQRPPWMPEKGRGTSAI